MIKLIKLPSGDFDVALDDPAEPDGAVQTVVYALLLTDARAPASREADAFFARGWWAGPQAGTGLWHVRRQALSADARRETIVMVEEALARSPVLTDIQVEDVSDSRSVSAVVLNISGQHNGRKFLIDLPL